MLLLVEAVLHGLLLPPFTEDYLLLARPIVCRKWLCTQDLTIHRQSLRKLARALRRDKHIAGGMIAGERVVMPPHLPALRIQMGAQTLGVSGGTLKHQMFGDVGNAFFAGVFIGGTGIDLQPHRQALAGGGDVENMINQAVIELALDMLGLRRACGNGG